MQRVWSHYGARMCSLCNWWLVLAVCLVAQVSKATVTFRDIIHQYRMQPQCKLHVFRNVFIDLPPWRRAGVCTL
jgi:hypothetical protein